MNNAWLFFFSIPFVIIVRFIKSFNASSFCLFNEFFKQKVGGVAPV